MKKRLFSKELTSYIPVTSDKDTQTPSLQYSPVSSRRSQCSPVSSRSEEYTPVSWGSDEYLPSTRRSYDYTPVSSDIQEQRVYCNTRTKQWLKNPLQHSSSFPVTGSSSRKYFNGHHCADNWYYGRLSSSHRRPLPLTPPQQHQQHQQQCLRVNKLSLQQFGSIRHQDQHHRELTRRQTFHSFPLVKINYDRDDHIYEEICDEDSSDDDDVLEKDGVNDDHSFLALISRERRKHLMFYGRADWDYGNERM